MCFLLDKHLNGNNKLSFINYLINIVIVHHKYVVIVHNKLKIIYVLNSKKHKLVIYG